MTLYHAFIRTHHITSRKKVATLKTAAKRLEVATLLRSGGVPGLMYVRGNSLEDLQSWVNVVHNLRYKDYRLICSASKAPDSSCGEAGDNAFGIEEVDTVRDMGAAMERKGLLDWWKKAMGFGVD